MMQKQIWNSYKRRCFLKNKITRLRRRIKRKLLGSEQLKVREKKQSRLGKTFMSKQGYHDYVIQALNSNESFMSARYGSVEARMFFESLGSNMGIEDAISPKSFLSLNRNAGFFPNDETLIPRFEKVMKEASAEIDVLCFWELGFQEYLLDYMCKADVKVTMLASLAPFHDVERPWTMALKGKKVLVIHPFEETIQSQYKKREKLWENPNILPEFELHTLKAVQTIAGQKDERFETWFEALDYMHQEAMKIDFDVAIIGCGAYGMPLAAKLKQSGKKAIHMGGITQVLFGIRGARWDAREDYIRCCNEYWVRPAASETPKNNAVVEGGCYW